MDGFTSLAPDYVISTALTIFMCTLAALIFYLDSQNTPK